MVKYFSHIPRAGRPRSIMLFYDCRHFMPGAERAFAKEDYAVSHPDLYSKVIASIGIEHLGQMKVEEGAGKPFHRTNVPDLTSIYITDNQHMVETISNQIGHRTRGPNTSLPLMERDLWSGGGGAFPRGNLWFGGLFFLKKK